MSPEANAAYGARLGLSRGWRNYLNAMANPQELFGIVLIYGLMTLMLFFRSDDRVSGLGISMGLVTLPSMMGLMTAFSGMTGVIGTMAVEREDGTLLRSKALPHGMVGHLVGSVVDQVLRVFTGMAILLVAGLFMIDGLVSAGLGGLIGLIAIILLGLAATLPWGAVVGALTSDPRTAGLIGTFPMMGLAAISGVFYPLTNLPGWLQGIAQVFPVYWIGLGARASILPDSAVAAEVGDSWRHLETLGVLGVWMVAGLLIAPRLLRRMARRESGSDMEARKQRALGQIR